MRHSVVLAGWQFALMWQLSGTGNWPLELTIDSLCLYVSGPAYLGAFVMEHTSFKPFDIDPAHPPVELRARALLAETTTLDWDAHTEGLKRLLETWRSREREASSINQRLRFIKRQMYSRADFNLQRVLLTA